MNGRRITTRIFRFLLVTVVLALILAATYFAGQRADRLLREDLLRQTRIVAMAINPNRVNSLTGTEADLSSRHYLWVKNQLASIRTANPKIRFISLMGRNPEGQVVVLVDSEPANSADCSPPGQIYFEASDSLVATFEANHEAVAGPATDRWGSWVSAFVPLPGVKFHKNPVLVSLDINATHWKRAVALQAVLPAVLSVIAVLLAAGTTLILRGRIQLHLRQRQLQESEARFIQLADESRTLAWQVDAQGLYTYVSPAVEPILGYRPDELVGRMHFYDLHPEEGRETVKEAAFRIFERKQPFLNFENPVQTRSGQWLWVLTNGFPLLDDTGHLLGYRGSDVDITERKRTEDQVRTLLDESNQSRKALLGILEDQMKTQADLKRLATAIEQAAEIFVITDAQGTIQYVNPAFEAVTGYTRQEAIGQNPRILHSGQQDAAFYRTLWNTISSGKTWRGRFINKRKNGSLYSEDAILSPVTDPAGRIINYVGVKHDITEHLRLSGQLQQSQKLDSIGRLAGGVAHDFNNMLGVILGHAEMAMEQTEPDHPLYGDLQEIRKAAERSAGLTRQLLAFARKQAVIPKVLDLNETVDGMLKMLRRLIGEDIDLVWLPKAGLWPVLMDPSQIDQILANLCVNARDAITGVGQITIETANDILGPSRAMEFPAATPGDYVRLDVRDTGSGMDADTLTHIFEPFFSTKAGGSGSGLGLATVYGSVTQNNGFIHVQSEPGQGTVFHIFLPRYTGTPDPEPQPKPSLPAARGHETILLVEDEPAILAITAQMLQGLGYTVYKASNPAEAIRLAREQTDPIHLLLTDVVMPDMNGLDLARKILILQPQIQCLFMSGYTADVIARNGLLEDGMNFIEKPFLKQTLAAKLRAVLDAVPA